MYKIDFLVSDFDGCITRKDMTYLLIEAAIDGAPGEDEKGELRRRWETLIVDYEAQKRMILNEVLAEAQGNNDYGDIINELSVRIEELEDRSSYEAGQLLVGVDRGKLTVISDDDDGDTMPQVMEVLSDMKEGGIDLYVLSAGWSRDLIEGVVGKDGVIPSSSVYVNDLVYGDDGKSVGGITGTIWSPGRKLEKFREIKEKHCVGGGKTAYVGNDLNDIMCVLDAADYGFIINPSEDLELLIDTLDIPGIEEKLVGSWKEIEERLGLS